MNSPAGMPCPVDGTTLVMSERQGIEIDYCPTCRGVWLDRGELDKIIARSASDDGPSRDEPSRTVPSGAAQPRFQRDERHPQKRRKSFFEDLFD